MVELAPEIENLLKEIVGDGNFSSSDDTLLEYGHDETEDAHFDNTNGCAYRCAYKQHFIAVAPSRLFLSNIASTFTADIAALLSIFATFRAGHQAHNYSPILMPRPTN